MLYDMLIIWCKFGFFRFPTSSDWKDSNCQIFGRLSNHRTHITPHWRNGFEKILKQSNEHFFRADSFCSWSLLSIWTLEPRDLVHFVLKVGSLDWKSLSFQKGRSSKNLLNPLRFDKQCQDQREHFLVSARPLFWTTDFLYCKFYRERFRVSRCKYCD